MEAHHLLRQHVERIARIAHGLHQALAHGPRGRGAGQQVGAKLGKDDAVADRAHVVSGAADALHSAGNRRRSLDLDDQVDGSHVNAKF